MTPSEMKLTSTDHPFATENVKPQEKKITTREKDLKISTKCKMQKFHWSAVVVQLSSRPILPTWTELIFLTFSHPDYFSSSFQLSTHFFSFCKWPPVAPCWPAGERKEFSLLEHQLVAWFYDLTPRYLRHRNFKIAMLLITLLLYRAWRLECPCLSLSS